MGGWALTCKLRSFVAMPWMSQTLRPPHSVAPGMCRRTADCTAVLRWQCRECDSQALQVVQKLVDGQKVYQLGPPPERVLLNLPCVMHSVRALDSPLMTEAALNWGFAPAAHRLAGKVIGGLPDLWQ